MVVDYLIYHLQTISPLLCPWVPIRIPFLIHIDFSIQDLLHKRRFVRGLKQKYFEYQKNHSENKVRISTRFGDIDLELYQNTPYHRANFVFLTKQGYFNGSTFHRVVPGFIIQGGNSDRTETAEKRRKIGKYLLPPDTRKGNQHHRGVISMPSSEIENPHKLASPYEFFIVQKDAFHQKRDAPIHYHDSLHNEDLLVWPMDNGFSF